MAVALSVVMLKVFRFLAQEAEYWWVAEKWFTILQLSKDLVSLIQVLALLHLLAVLEVRFM